MKYPKFLKSVCSLTLVTALMAAMLPPGLLKASASSAWDPYSQYLNSNNPKKEDMRATWITTVYNSDWPSEASTKITDTATRVAEQKQELCKILDTAVADNMNAVMFQVRSQCDALYQSQLVPWSVVMTGTAGGDPGFDPLQYAIDEAHKRGLELHAWMNPYRAGTALSDATVAQLKALPNSIFHTHPEWIQKAYDGTYVIDPGIPEARAWVESCVMEVVNNYDIDGIHFDDYFYHEATQYGFDDSATFAQYGAGYTDRGDWRRNNTYLMVKELSQQIRSSKPWVTLGVSPAGMWGNIKDGHPNGSPTAGGEPNYDRDFADTLRWANEGLIDYVCPQVYWPFGRDVAPYGTIATWWADHITNPNTKVYIGMGLYRVNDTTNSTETDLLDPNAKTEMLHEIQLNQNYPNISGSFLYQASNIVPGSSIYKQDAVENGIKVAWANKAFAPTTKWKSSVAPAMPKNVTATAVSGGTQVSWQDGDANGTTMYYAVYRFAANDAVKDTSNPTKLITVVGKDTTSYLDTATADPGTVSYVVTALDNLHNESTPKAVTPVSAADAGVTTTAGVSPALPVSVKVHMSDGSIANMMVKWNSVDSSSYTTAGSAFDVTGQVIYSNGNPTGLTVKAHVTVAAKSIQYVCPITVKTEQFTAPVFPALVNVIYTDNTVGSVSVTWQTPDASTYASAASVNEYQNPTVFGIKGTVAGTGLKAEGNYIVYPAASGYSAVNVTTHAGTAPILPASVTATYTDGSTADVAVTWDQIPANNYAKTGTFTVSGAVAGAAKKVTASVTVQPAVTIVATDPVCVKTPIGVAPKLPGTVNVTYSDGMKDTLKITWPAVDPAVQCAATHRFSVTGTINDSTYTVAATVEVDSSVILDDFENGTVTSGIAKSKIQWTGDSVASPSTAPTLSYDTTVVHSGNASLKVAYDFSKATGTASAYLRPNSGKGIVFQKGEVPSKIGFWVYGNNVTTYALRCEFRAGTTATSPNTNQNINNTLNFTGWRYLEYPVDPSYQSTGLCVTLMPGIIEIQAASKVNTAIYIDDLTATYGSDTKDTNEIQAAVTTAQGLYGNASDSMKAIPEYSNLSTEITGAMNVLNNSGATNSDLYAATDSLNAAIQAFTDKSSLNDAISNALTKVAQSSEGNKPGQYVPGTLAAFGQTINAAKAVFADRDATHAGVQSAIFQLTQAGKAMDDQIVPPLDLTALNNAVDTAKALKNGAKVGTEPGQYPLAAVNLLTDAISAADHVRNGTDEAQPDVDAAVTALNGAVAVFRASVTPTKDQGISKQNVISQINTDSQKTVSVPLSAPGTVPGDVFASLAGKDKEVTFSVLNDDDQLQYSWTFNGSGITKSDVSLNLAISFGNPVDEAVTKLLANTDSTNNLFINFAYHGQLPGQATIRVYVGNRYKDGSSVNLYYLDTDNGKIVTMANNLTVSGGYVCFDITHCSSYMLAPVNASDSTATSDNPAANGTVTNPKTGSDEIPDVPAVLVTLTATCWLLRERRRFLRNK